MTVTSTAKAVEYFQAKMDFTTGPIELNNMIQQGEKINIIDVRKSEDYAKGHIPGAVNLPEENWQSFSALSRNQVNIIYCYSGVCHLAAKAALFFAKNDYSVMELEGGFDEWHRHGLPVES